MAGAERHDLTLPADPALGATLRIWVAEAARTLDLGGSTIEDLRLVASELFANGVSTGSDRVVMTLGRAGEDWELVVDGAGQIEDGDIGGLRIGRLDLLRAVATVDVGPGGTVSCRGPASS